MNNRFYHLLSPVRIGETVLKNRMISSNAMPHFLQGPEQYPAESMISYYAGLARNGAAMVTFPERLPADPGDAPPDAARMPYFDIYNYSYQNYFSQLADAVHFYQTKLSISLVPMLPKGYGVCDRPAMTPDERSANPETADAPPFSGMGALKEASTEMVQETIEAVAQKALLYKQCGFDAVSFHASYRGSSAGQFLSPLCNRRHDQYGGDSVESRSRFILELARRIKELCGKSFIIEAQITAVEDGGTTMQDTVTFAKLAEGVIDILQLRTANGRTAHPTGFNSRPGSHMTLAYAEAVKKSGAKILVAPIGGYQAPDEIEQYLAQGKMDMIAMGRAFICDPEYGKKLYENRSEDIVPCLLCNKCHESAGRNERFVSTCSVNPYMGIGHRINTLVSPPEKMKKVAVIGGGPAGMRAAIELRRRGHTVVLYEQADALGGQLRHSDVVSFKWPLSRFKNYLIAQTYKAGADVFLNTKATPEMIKAGGFDAVIAALGATPKVPAIVQAPEADVWIPTDVYGNEPKLGRRVVVIGQKWTKSCF